MVRETQKQSGKENESLYIVVGEMQMNPSKYRKLLIKSLNILI